MQRLFCFEARSDEECTLSCMVFTISLLLVGLPSGQALQDVHITAVRPLDGG
mgnify:CR=1 FL=1